MRWTAHKDVTSCMIGINNYLAVYPFLHQCIKHTVKPNYTVTRHRNELCLEKTIKIKFKIKIFME